MASNVVGAPDVTGSAAAATAELGSAGAARCVASCADMTGGTLCFANNGKNSCFGATGIFGVCDPPMPAMEHRRQSLLSSTIKHISGRERRKCPATHQ